MPSLPHPPHCIGLLLLALTSLLPAEVPRKEPLTKYARLWTDSPFTAKPPPPQAGPASNPLEDYVLAGVAPIAGGYRVTLLSKKEPDRRIYVFSDQPDAKHGFRILGIDRKPGDPMGTVVRMQSGALTGTVAYDEKLLTIAAAQPKPGQPGQPGQPNAGGVARPAPAVLPGQPNPNQPNPNPNQRQPRQRVVGGQPGQAGQSPQIIQPPPPIPVPTPNTTPTPNQARPIRR